MVLRLATLALVVLAVSLPGCGGDDGDPGGSPSTTADTSTQATTTEKDRPEERDAAKKRKERGEREKPAADGPKERPTLEKAVARLPDAKVERFLRRALGKLLKRIGIRGSALALSSDRDTLTITVPPDTACKATVTDEDEIAQTVREILPFVQTVVIVVEGGESFASYVESSCDRPELPGGSGRVVFEEKGSGVVNTKPFRIESKRWVVEYAQHGKFFSIFVAKGASGKKYEQETVTTQRPGSGRKEYGGPGTFRLSINGSGDWTVRVRELP